MGNIIVKWVGSQLMIGADSSGHSLVIGRWPEQSPEWAGLKPSDLLLLAAASCSAHDVVMIMQRQREPLLELEVACSGTQLTDPPFTFTAIHLHYVARGPIDARKLERAIALSEEKYCSVVTTLKPSVQVTHDYEIAGDSV